MDAREKEIKYSTVVTIKLILLLVNKINCISHTWLCDCIPLELVGLCGYEARKDGKLPGYHLLLQEKGFFKTDLFFSTI